MDISRWWGYEQFFYFLSFCISQYEHILFLGQKKQKYFSSTLQILVLVIT